MLITMTNFATTKQLDLTFSFFTSSLSSTSKFDKPAHAPQTGHCLQHEQFHIKTSVSLIRIEYSAFHEVFTEKVFLLQSQPLKERTQ